MATTKDAPRPNNFASRKDAIHHLKQQGFSVDMLASTTGDKWKHHTTGETAIVFPERAGKENLNGATMVAYKLAEAKLAA